MPSQAELDAQNNASRARQQARRGIEQPAPQMQQPYVNPYGGQYGTDSIQDQDYYNNYYDDEGMTDEEWAAYLAGLEEGQGYQEEPSYYSDYGSRMPDGPIEALYPEESSWMDNLSFGADKFRGKTPFQQPDWFQKPIYRVSNDLNQFSNAQQEPEAETPFLQYLQKNTEQSQGGGANQMEQGSAGSPQSNYYDFVQRGGQMNDEQLRQANEMAMSMGTTFDPETGYSRQPYQDYQEQGPQVQAPMSISDTRGMLQAEREALANRPGYGYGGAVNDQYQSADFDTISRGIFDTPMTGMRPINSETGEPLSQGVIDAAARAGLELPMGSVPLPKAPVNSVPMGQDETRARLGGRTLNEYLNAPDGAVSGLRTDPQGRMIPAGFDNRADAYGSYEREAAAREARQAARPDFGKSYKSIEDDRITRDIDKYDNRRTFAEARRLVPTERDKSGRITNQAQQRAAMTLTEKEVQDKKRDEYNEEYRAKNLERIQQTIDNGNKPGASKLEKKKRDVAEEILLVQETYANYQPWMGQAIEADRMNIVPAPSGFKSHLDFAAYQNNFNLDELYETMNQENNGGGGAAPVRPRPPAPSNSQPRAGDVIEGHRFNGGDPSKKENWTKV